MICYVCKKEIKETRETAPRRVLFLASEQDRVYHITSPVYVGNDTYRHKLCEPGGARWMMEQQALPKKKRSELYKDFLKAGKENVLS